MKKVYLYAFYTAGTAGRDIFHADPVADRIMENFDADDIGRGTFLPTMERDIQWEINEEDAANAAVLLRDAGFRTEIEEIK